MAKKERKHNFVVGYKGDGNPVIGKDDDYFKGADPLTLFQAMRDVKKLPCRGAAIFKLVELKH